MEKLLLFDVDGTLIDKCEAHKTAFRVALKSVLGVEWTPGVSYAGRMDRFIISDILRKKGFSENQIASNMDAIINEMISYVRKNIASDTSKAIPHVMEILPELKKRYTLGLLTGNIEKIAELKLGHAGLMNFFSCGGFGEVTEKRSDLVGIATKNAEEKTGKKFSKSSIFVIGDTPHDIACGKENGVKTIVVCTGPYSRKELEKHNPDYLFDDFSDTDAVIKAIESPR